MDLKTPLNTLKYRMQMKVEVNDGYKCFSDELDKITADQAAFLDKFEYHVAKAEDIDQVQATIFKINNRYMISPPYEFFICLSLCTHVRSFSYVTPYPHMCLYMHPVHIDAPNVYHT